MCSKQPNALLKIFPLRVCSLLNVVIMQNVFLPLASTPPLILPVADINGFCINIQEPGREPHRAVPITVRGPIEALPS